MKGTKHAGTTRITSLVYRSGSAIYYRLHNHGSTVMSKYQSIELANNMIAYVLKEVRKGRETKYQDGMRKAEDWFNNYRYDHELDQNTITETMRLYYKWLEESEII